MDSKLRAYDPDSGLIGKVLSIDWQEGAEHNVAIKLPVDVKPFLTAMFDEVTLIRSTEFSDKNGVEIYEGDIAKHGGYREWPIKSTAIEFKNGRFQTDGAWLNDYEDWDIEIIGNIYENPELLTK